MADQPGSVGLAELAAQLIAEVFEAVAASRVDQERQLGELAEAIRMPAAEYAGRFVTPDEVNAHLARLFPSADAKLAHGVAAKAQYAPAAKGRDESPAIERILGVRLERKDYTLRKDGVAELKAVAAKRVFQAARAQVAQRKQATAAQLVANGLPRVVIDSGVVRAKVTLSTTTVSETAKAGTGGKPATLPGALARLGSAAPKLSSPAMRVLARHVDPSDPQTSRTRTDVYGELELTFKTVV